MKKEIGNSNSFKISCDKEGNYRVEHNGKIRDFGKDFQAANKYMFSLIRPSKGDPK